MKIKNIKINAFRGIPDELEINLDGKSLLLLGENGTGKSSIIDAIEFFFTGKISHLMSKGPLALNDHGPNTKNLSKPYVTLEINPGSHIISRTFGSNLNAPKILQKDFDLAQKGQFILRRSQILKLVNTIDSERYKFISDIIGSENLEKIDTAIYQANNQFKKDSARIEEKLEKIKKDIISTLEIQEYDEIIPKINLLLSNEGLDNINSTKELELCLDSLHEIIKSSNDQLNTVLNSISSLTQKIATTTRKLNGEFLEAETLRKRIIESQNQSDLPLLKILKNSLEIINNQTTQCPVCETNIDSEKLLKQINKRLENLQTLKENNDSLKESLTKVNDKIKGLRIDLTELSSKIDYFEEFKDFKDLIDPEIDTLNKLQKDITHKSFLENESREKIISMESVIEEFLQKIKTCSDGLKGSIKPSKKEEQLKSLHGLLKDLDEKLSKYNKYQQKFEISKNHAQISEIIYTEFSDIKKKKIQEVYNLIQDNVEHYYGILHPLEPYQNITLGVDPKKKGSTNLRMTIFGKEDKDPRSLSSEGHLDSLGLCIFLALFKEVYKDFPLLVLDDVVTTMDSRHRENVCKLLFEEFKDKQFIITTHDSIWFDQLKAAQRVHNLNNNFKNCTIVGWDEDTGPEIRPYKPRWTKIQEKIKDGDRNCAGNEGRRYLECLLDQICKNFDASVPRKSNGLYTVNDLIGPAKTRLKKKIKDEELNLEIEVAFQHLERTLMMGNLLSHDNIFAGNISIKEVENFCNSIHVVKTLVSCPTCNSFLQYYRDLNIVRCSNKSCKRPFEA